MRGTSAAWGLVALLVVATSGCALLGREVRAAPPPATTTEPDPKTEFLGDANRLCYAALQGFDGRSFTTWEVARDWLVLGKQIMDEITWGIAALTPPPGDEATVASLVASLGELSAILAQGEVAPGPTGVLAAYEQYDDAHGAVQAALDDYGLVGCNIR